MGLANLYQPPLEEGGWQEFWFNNWIDHQEIQQAIQTQTGANQVVYIIDPWINEDANGILQRHQQYHNDMNAALGLNGQDLSTLEFNKPEAIAAWVYQHFQEHQSAHQTLGI